MRNRSVRLVWSAFAVLALGCGGSPASVPDPPPAEPRGGSPPASAVLPPPSPPPIAPAADKRVFVTRGKWSGDLRGAAWAAGAEASTGIAGGDALCTVSARGAALGGTWKAWLSDGATNAIDRLADVGPWHRLDGAIAFAGKAALAGDPGVAIDLDETGAPVDYAPWTGTLADGTKAEQTCNDWQSDASVDHGLCGSNTSVTQRKWSEATVPLCDHGYNLYCFEQ